MCVGTTEKNPLLTRPQEVTHRSDQQQRGQRDGDDQPCLSVEGKFRLDHSLDDGFLFFTLLNLMVSRQRRTRLLKQFKLD